MITEAGLLAVVRDRSQPDLTQRAMALLIVLKDGQPVLTRDLAAAIGSDKSPITRHCDTLLRLGYVKRWRGTEDRRDCYVSLTAAGRRYLAALANGKARAA